ncbi:hypothetical protein J5500_00255 [Candidatus Saccharibacteria bacterium]|nr:hypothetical protein [Candidatus Saccharibacteria bacterium]
MYEISLVPDVKSELLQKQKLRNLIIFVCIIVAGACVGVILILLSITGGQALTIGAQEKEIGCRANGVNPNNKNDSCSDYGVPVMNFKNVNELLTIQDQMKNIGALNANKIKFSRIFGLLDVILPDGSANGDKVQINQLSANVSQNVLSFDAIGEAGNNIGFHALETFKKGALKTYFDYGKYMRSDGEGGYVEIPSFCISEYTEKGYTYAKYFKGNPGCEAPMVEKTEEASDEQGEQTESTSESSEGSTTETTEESTETKTEEVKKEVIIIRRTYDSSEDREEYKNGNDRKAKDKKDDKKDKNEDGAEEDKKWGYYFESECLKYKEDTGEFDEEATLEACPLLVENGLNIGSSSYGRGAEDQMVLSFSASITLDPRVFKNSSSHMQIIGPSRQNVTDSYVQIRDMFTPKAKEIVNDGGDK